MPDREAAQRHEFLAESDHLTADQETELGELAAWHANGQRDDEYVSRTRTRRPRTPGWEPASDADRDRLRQQFEAQQQRDGQTETIRNDVAGFGQPQGQPAERMTDLGGHDPAAAISRARRLIDTRHAEGALPDAGAEHATELLTDGAAGPEGLAARYVMTAGSAAYERAF